MRSREPTVPEILALRESRAMVNPSTALAPLLLTTAGWLGLDHLATRLELEVLVALVALTTFLIGFSTVRLQTRLEEQVADNARRTERIIEENYRADMLPLPSELQRLRPPDVFDVRDRLTKATEYLSMFNLALSGLLVFFHWQFYEGLPETERDLRYSYIGYVLILVLHLFIVALGRFASFNTTRQASKEWESSVSNRYMNLQFSLARWLERLNNPAETPNAKLQKEENLLVHSRKVIGECNHLEQVMPSWPWLTLVRASAEDEDHCDIPSLKRVHNLAAADKDRDDFSLIAYVWSAYLKDLLDTRKDKDAFSASVLVRLDELKSLDEFAESSRLSRNAPGLIFAGLALKDVQKQVERRGPPSDALRELFERMQQRLSKETFIDYGRPFGPPSDEVQKLFEQMKQGLADGTLDWDRFLESRSGL